ncbi:hypothetical protein DEI97_013575 [Curtobacterium sp. MCLR17_032]|uniref:hypothetical protein n=1 Tax=Curtobacterium sp. MCLR17_032 TaxID=2175650 RepID=UPI000DA808FD|nr:hypothetical protein [Curtobacterium sp. MCLR17_032]WIE60771.1 hypothetical protein DEI97_013575 [Curtobacterium sp. MCLR17_032]
MTAPTPEQMRALATAVVGVSPLDEEFEEAASALRAAADELDRLRKETVPRVWFHAEMARLKDALVQRDRLRSVIAARPHDDLCEVWAISGGTSDVGCTCWKADAL